MTLQLLFAQQEAVEADGKRAGGLWGAHEVLVLLVEREGKLAPRQDRAIEYGLLLGLGEDVAGGRGRRLR